ncbi:HdeD family acid-resistance protein [Helicobacter fennelliae]
MKTFGSILWVLFSVMTIVAGVIGCFTPMETFLSFVFLLPVFLIVGGISNVIYYFNIKSISGANFVLLDGLLSIVFALVFIFGGLEFTSLTFVYFVAFMTLFKGILGIGYAFEVKKIGLDWVWILILGILNIIIALLFIANPKIAGLTIGVLIALFVLFFGLASLFGWWGSKKFFSQI